MLIELHGGEVPRSRTDLEPCPVSAERRPMSCSTSPLVSRRWPSTPTSFRVGNRTGLAPGKTPLAVELGLLDRIPEPYLVDAHHWLILHGRYVCQARKPLCGVCAVINECDTGRNLKSVSA